MRFLVLLPTFLGFDEKIYCLFDGMGSIMRYGGHVMMFNYFAQGGSSIDFTCLFIHAMVMKKVYRMQTTNVFAVIYAKHVDHTFFRLWP